MRAPRGRESICSRLCKSLVFVVGATACSASRVVGDYVVDATDHALREVSLGDEAAYRIADFPLTAEVAVAEFLVAQAERRLEIVGDTDDGRSRLAVYELPDDEGSRPRTPRTR